MTGPILKALDVTNFRSIRGHIQAPLDAKVVLVHGENGAGKTSLLSAIELALTGRVASLQRADAGYAKQLLHRAAAQGDILLKTCADGKEQTFETRLDAKGVHCETRLEERLAAFFSERAYLPQSLLGQLLQIYQDSGSDKDSPLAKFVGKLLGLDRLDALEAGLKPLIDVRNVRKVVGGWSAAETERTRLERLLDGQRRTRASTVERLDADLKQLGALCTTLALGVEVKEANLDQVDAALLAADDSAAFQTLSDRGHELGTIRRDIAVAGKAAPEPGESGSTPVGTSYDQWETAHGAAAAALRGRIEGLLPDVALPGELGEFVGMAQTHLLAAAKQVSDRAAQARSEAARLASANAERDAARRQLAGIDAEVASMTSDAGGLAAALSELASFIKDDVCPVCERDFAETASGPLADHVHARVRELSGSAARLLTLGRARGDAQALVERLEREIEALTAKAVAPKELTELDRRNAAFETAIAELGAMADILRDGGQRLAADIAARRAASLAQSRNLALLAARETLGAFALAIGAPPLGETETFDAAAARLQTQLETEYGRLDARLTARREAMQLVAAIRTTIERRTEIDSGIQTDMAAWQETDRALNRAQALRDQGLAMRNAVDTVRSTIIRREFNDRLNRLWRDLFVRLAPAEPFVPAFRIPSSATHRLQPKLITHHRFGGQAGGTPGAMLSAGNLNTAALTLFLALHLSVPAELPWLILDDPVQSMDDVHIAHFAALLRTLSKEQGRQVVIAVHDRQLFEYLRLELSPAFADDSLLTLELSRASGRDTLCADKRYGFREETTLLAAA